MNVSQPSWDIYEAAVLLDAFVKINENKLSLAEAVKKVSGELRQMAVNRGLEIDDTYRNENGIRFHIYSMQSAYGDENVTIPGTRIFEEIVTIYKTDPAQFERILNDAKKMIFGKQPAVITPQLDIYKNRLGFDNNTHNVFESIVSFSESNDYSHSIPLWFRYKGHDVVYAKNWSKLYALLMKELTIDYPEIFVAGLSFINGDRVDIAKIGESYKLRRGAKLTDNLLIETNLSANRIVNRISTAASMVGLTDKDIVICYVGSAFREKSKLPKAHTYDSKELIEKVEKLIHNSPYGITEDEICRELQEHSAHQIRQALTSCSAVVVLKRYYHKDNISDYQEMADILLEVINRQFSLNGNYTSSKQLYDEVRPKLDDFFFYNNAFDSRREIYDLALQLFERDKYKGNSFVFAGNMHIWKEDPDYPKDCHGLMIKYAREHGNTFTRKEVENFFTKIGFIAPSATFSNVIFGVGRETFLQYAENRYVLSEAISIDEYFLAAVKVQIKKLLENEDYIAFGEIDDYFYTTLSKLPGEITWSALLLKDVLQIYDIGFTTIEAGKDNNKKTVPAALVRKDMYYRSFGDVVVKEISKEFTLPKEFTAEEFRNFLIEKGFIHENEKRYNVYKTVEKDIRFYWIDNNKKVIIS